MGEIYKITNINNDKSYIGQAVSIFPSGRKHGGKGRWKDHVYNAKIFKNQCPLLENAIRKYGEKIFELTILEYCSVEILNEREIFYIEKYSTISPGGYNLMTGGGNGRKHSEETKQKMSISRCGKVHTEKTKKAIGNAHKGKNISPEQKNTIGKRSKYRNMKEENKKRVEEILKDTEYDVLPMYVLYIPASRGRSEGFGAIKPNHKHKIIISSKYTAHEKLQIIINYLNELNH